jgi:hypothetical protein
MTRQFVHSILIYISIFCCISISTVTAQKSEAIKKFYQLEQQTWQTHLSRSADFGTASVFDVTFYHIDIEINIDSAYVSGSVLCRFRSNADGLSSIKLHLQRALKIRCLSSWIIIMIAVNGLKSVFSMREVRFLPEISKVLIIEHMEPMNH